MSKCFVCGKKLGWSECYGSLLEEKNYCQKHNLERLLKEAKKEVKIWETEIKCLKLKQKEAKE